MEPPERSDESLQCSCFPVREDPCGSTESLDEELVSFEGLEVRGIAFCGRFCIVPSMNCP